MKKMPPGFVASLLLLPLLLTGCDGARRDVLWQTSTIGALSAGVYDGQVTLAELARHGDIGLGTFNALDGEMLVVDGCVYQVGADGKARVPDPKTTRTPFAAVTFFENDRMIALNEPWDYAAFRRHLDDALDSPNVPYALRIDGEFSYVKVRSIPRQDKPYRPMAQALKNQTVFEHKDVAGTMVGFRLPRYLGGVNAAGCHLHFLTADRKAGGHVLELRIKKARLLLDLTDRLHLVLPDTGPFYQAALERPARKDAQPKITPRKRSQ